MQNASRRAFFGGKAPEIRPWDQLRSQLQRKTQGKLSELEQAEQVVFKPSALTDLYHARQSCHTFGARLCVLGLQAPLSESTTPIVWLDLSALNQLLPLDAQKNQWFMQAGVSMGQLREAGFAIDPAAADTLNVAQWLADAQYQPRQLAQLAHSGLVHASLLTADGAVNSLGLFGVRNGKPLNTAFLQRIVPQLFQLAASELAQVLLAQPQWLGRYRLDIFGPDNSALNLAHLLLGHGGSLGILEWVVLDKTAQQASAPSAAMPKADSTLQIAATELDAAVKQLFDPDGLFAFNSSNHALFHVALQHV